MARNQRNPAAPAANRVREWRKARGLSLHELAAAVGAGLSFGHLARIERGQRDLSIYWMERLAPVLDCAPADLLNPELGGLSARERLLIDTYRDLPEGLRAGYDALRESHQPFRGAPEVIDLADRLPRKTA